MPSTPKPTKLYHPAFPDVSQDVAAADVESWTEAGWRKTPLKSDATDASK